MAQEKTTNKMLEELGKWLMDVSKYILTAVIISTMFSEIADKLITYGIGAILVISTLLTGMVILKRNSTTKKRK